MSEKSTDLAIRVIVVISSFVALLAAALGIALQTPNKHKTQIDSLNAKIDSLQVVIQELSKSDKDTIVVDVKIKPQVIKIYNSCTD